LESEGRSPTVVVEGAGAVLSLIREGRAQTVSQLAAAMDMARSTVMQRVDRLVAAGLVVSRPAFPSESPGGRGRPASLFHFNADSGVILVAQLGMTGARVAATNLNGAILAENFEPFPIESGPQAVTDHLKGSLASVLSAAGRSRGDVRGLGIGLPSAIELATARPADAAPGPSWDGFSITDQMQDEFGVPAFVDNDVNLLALGEHASSWPDADVLLCLKVGTVIGCGTVIHGKVVQGAQRVAGSIGHISLVGDQTLCRCGNVGCLEAVASGRALVTQLRAEGLPVEDVRHLALLAREGVPAAVQAVRTAGRRIGEVLACAVNLLNPDVVTVWGYLADAELLAGIRETVYQRSLPAATGSLKLVPARLGDDAGLVGAAMIVVSQILSPSAIDEYLTALAPRPIEADRMTGAAVDS
jgi:predicted NBD/HSP70 family sugar kinase